METAIQKKKSFRQQALFRMIVLVAIVVLLNILSSAFFTRVDLTSDKRYTLSDSTKQMLRMLNDKVFVKVMLTGEMPAGFKRLSTSTKELLNELKVYAGDNLQYEFEDPLSGKSESEKQQIFKEMGQKGLQPTNIKSNEADEYSEKIIIPGALVYYHSKEVAVNLLVNENGIAPQEALNNSVSQLENKFSAAIRQLIIERKPKVAFLYGQGELKSYYLADFLKSLFAFYEADTLNLSHVVNVKKDIDVIVVAKPTEAFNEKDKFKLDQYIMRGGKVLWLLDALNADLDSLAQKPTMLTMDLPLNLEDQLFTYGVRVNPDLLLDLQSNPVPLLVNNNPGAAQPEFRLFPCYYFPVLTPDVNHIITKNVDAVSTMFTSTVDTVNVKEVKKTVLLHSSKYSKLAFTPWQIDFKELKNKPQQETFNKHNQPVAVLLEGNFSSVYKNRLAQETIDVMNDSLKTPFLDKSVPTKMIVVGDGDIIKNDFSKGRPTSLGFYKYTGEYFNNKNFLLNCIDYLTGHPNQIETRTKTVKLRLLDIQKVKAEKLKWQLINLLIPIGIIILFGLLFTFVRVRKYAGL